MKTMMRFLAGATMVLALVATSCSKEGDIGPIGPQGPQGEQGIQGPEGPQGPAGQDADAQENSAGGQTEGEQGENGQDGSNGADGANGSDGEDGQDGADGATGAQGPRGEQGPQGETGPQGEPGENGQDGENGEDGNANVIASKWRKSSFQANPLVAGLYQYTIDDSEIDQDVLNGYAVLGYLSLNDDFGSVQQIPYETVLLGATYTFSQRLSSGAYHIDQRISTSRTPLNYYVRYVLIAPSNFGKGVTVEQLRKMPYKEAMDKLGLGY